jgi:methylmalonyl-CoA mutase N-terminal domain/subunit
MKLRFHAQTGGSTLTAQQIDNNVVRVTLQALAAVLGGCQSLHTNARDEALALPTEASARLALRTQQVIAFESGVADTVDPLGGSYFLEALTDEVEARAEEYIKEIDSLGGAVRAIEQQYYQRHIAESAYSYQMAVEKNEKIIVGVNAYVSEDAEAEELFRMDEALRERQIEKLRQVRAARSQSAVDRALEGVKHAAGSRENIMPHILGAVEAYTTVGEISDALRSVWGEHEG